MKNETYIGDRTPVIANGRLFEFGHYTKNGCIVYESGKFVDKKPYFFNLNQVHVPTREELNEHDNG